MKKIALMLRTREDASMAPWHFQYYLCDHYKIIFDKLGVMLFPIYSGVGYSEIAEYCDGLIITGSAKDVYPEYYGKERLPGKEYSDIDEYAEDCKIIREFDIRNKPMLGICGGIQVMNVFYGGTLLQSIPGHGGNFGTFGEEITHKISVKPGSFLYGVYNSTEADVNTYHHQCVDTPAPGFEVTAKSADGYVEAIENGNKIGLQWHPEVSREMPIFETFIKKFL